MHVPVDVEASEVVESTVVTVEVFVVVTFQMAENGSQDEFV